MVIKKATESKYSSEKEEVFWINDKKVKCSHLLISEHYCYKVLYSDQLSQLEKNWVLFYYDIEGFKYVPGTTYRVKVMKKMLKRPKADAPAFDYELVEILQSIKK